MVFLNAFKITAKLGNGVAAIATGQVRAISSKAMRHRNPVNKPAPFYYTEKRYNLLRAFFDDTLSRFDDNTKLVVIDGPPTAGKAQLAKELADELDMVYSPAPTMDYLLHNDYGYDMRQLDPQLPEDCRSFDETNFLQDPSCVKAWRLRMWKLELRFRQHLEALAHILNTGQGVVMDRSPFSDHVYTEAMAAHKLCSQNFLSHYHRTRNNAIHLLWRPHLVIYLDVPAAEVRRRIEARNRPHEVDSPVSTTQYLQTLEDVYKKDYLKTISEHAEVLVYDWSEKGETEVVVEDVERIDFDQYGVYDAKMKDWRRLNKWDWNSSRYHFTHEQDMLLCNLNVPAMSCPELYIDGEDYKKFEPIWNSAPGNKYAKGFNADMGDTNLLLKLK